MNENSHKNEKLEHLFPQNVFFSFDSRLSSLNSIYVISNNKSSE